MEIVGGPRRFARPPAVPASSHIPKQPRSRPYDHRCHRRSEAQHLENGRIVAIAGPVIDVEFPPHALPEINTATR